MKRLLTFFFLLPFTLFSQDAAKNFCIPLSASALESPPQIVLNWTENNASGTEYKIYRKLAGADGWGSSIGTVNVGATSYTDNNVQEGVSYEYLVQKVTGGSLYSWGYINAGIRTVLAYNRGDFLILVDGNVADSLTTEISQLEEDLYNDGWNVTTEIVPTSDGPQEVKATIQSYYNSLTNLNTVYILGHVAVPYSGNLYPDAHPDHEGAWPADVYYADLDGTWTDASVNNTVANDSRNDNVPGDGKFDQSKVPSELELQVCRVDFHDLPAYTDSEITLLRNYLQRAHDFKIAAFVPVDRALYDQGGFTSYAEGFAQNGIRNFTPFVGLDSLVETDYFGALATESYLWSYGCGAGSYTSAGGLENGTSLTSAELAATPSNAVFTMLFGSYFGDWDRSNNLLRAALASGTTLSISWAGRPNWHYHLMAQGATLGESAFISMNKNTDYLSLDLGGGFVTWEGVHVAQFGDPSLRAYYVQPAADLTVSNVNNDADLSWTASTDPNLEGYNIYRRTSTTDWVKVNTSLVTSTSFIDTDIPYGEEYEYMVKAVSIKYNGSGSFYNESLGTTDSEQFTVGVEQVDIELNVYPVPAVTNLNITSSEQIETVVVVSSTGQIVNQIQVNQTQTSIDVSDLASGTYILMIQTHSGLFERNFVKN